MDSCYATTSVYHRNVLQCYPIEQNIKSQIDRNTATKLHKTGTKYENVVLTDE
jgi:hypothetical protein